MDVLILTGRLYSEDKNYCDNEAVLGAPRVHVTWPQLNFDHGLGLPLEQAEYALWCKQGGGQSEWI